VTQLRSTKMHLVMQFLERLKAEGLSLARQMGYVQRLTAIAVMLEKDFVPSAG
jgi:hypothetical protein